MSHQQKQTILGIIVTLQDFCLCSYILLRHTLFLLHSIPGHSQNSLIGMWSECHWWSPHRSTVFCLIVCAHQEIDRTQNISNWGNQYSYGPLPVISTYNPIDRMYNPIEITSYSWFQQFQHVFHHPHEQSGDSTDNRQNPMRIWRVEAPRSCGTKNSILWMVNWTPVGLDGLSMLIPLSCQYLECFMAKYWTWPNHSWFIVEPSWTHFWHADPIGA